MSLRAVVVSTNDHLLVQKMIISLFLTGTCLQQLSYKDTLHTRI